MANCKSRDESNCTDNPTCKFTSNGCYPLDYIEESSVGISNDIVPFYDIPNFNCRYHYGEVRCYKE